LTAGGVRPVTAGGEPRRGRTAAVGAAVAAGGAFAYAAARFRRLTADPFDIDEPPAPGTPEFARLIEAVTGMPLREGCGIRILRNGCRTFPAMLDAIASARRTVDFSSYIYWPGQITTQFNDAFVDRAEAGVAVRVVLDGYGSARFDRAGVERLERAGVKVAFFRPPRWYTVGRVNNRMHRRLLVVDGRVGFAGGVGIADMWTGDAQDPDHWRETHARLEGPAVRDILGGFLESWTESTGEIVAGPRLPALAAVDGGVPLQVTRSSPVTGATAAAELFYLAIVGARKRIWLTTAYFTAGRRFLQALCDAARRGVDVRILVNGQKVDKQVVRRAGQRSYGELLDAGVRIFEYQRTMLHAKTLVVDEEWANIGSSNFDHRSFALDAELNVAIQDRGVAAEIAGHFLDDLEAAEEWDLERWRARPLHARAYEYVGELARQSF